MQRLILLLTLFASHANAQTCSTTTIANDTVLGNNSGSSSCPVQLTSPTVSVVTTTAPGGFVGDGSVETIVAAGGNTARTLSAAAADVVNIKYFGAYGDTKQWADGTISSGSTTFTSNYATFTSADCASPGSGCTGVISKTIQIDGASGAGSAPLVTTIAGFTNSHSVTLATAASATTQLKYAPVKLANPPSVQNNQGSGSYVPGDIVSVSGGTGTSSAQVKIFATTVVSATVATGGSGGTTSAGCTVTGTTGNAGPTFTAIVVISGGAITSVSSISAGGIYTANPTTISNEPVALGSCSGLTGGALNVVMGVKAVVGYTTGAYSSIPANPVSTGAGSISGATGLTLNMTWSTSGYYYYGHDDTAALSAAVTYVNTTWNATQQVPQIYIPAGIYYIGSSPTQFAQAVPGAVVGDSPNKTYLMSGTNVSGPLISWDEAWGAGKSTMQGYTTNNGQSYFYSGESEGPQLRNLTLSGDLNNTNSQSAVTFYDRNDAVLMQNVQMIYFNGPCMTMGNTNVGTQAYVRESKFYNIRAWYCGNSSNPAVNISSTTTSSSDATNELAFWGIDVFAPFGNGLNITNSGGYSATRLIRFYGLRIEDVAPGFDSIHIGDSTLTGSVSAVQIYGLEENNSAIGGSGIAFNANSAAYAPTGFQIQGLIQTGQGFGVTINSGSDLYFTLQSLGTSGTNFVVGPSSGGIGPMKLDTQLNNLSSITTAVNSTSVGYVNFPVYSTSNFSSASMTFGSTYTNPTYSFSGTGLLSGGGTLSMPRVVVNSSTPSSLSPGIYSPTSGSLGWTCGSTPALCAEVDANKNLIVKGSFADQSYSLQSPTTGFSITIANNISTLILNPAGTLASGTITMPASPIDGQKVQVSCSQTVTSLTVAANSGQTILGAPTTCSATSGIEYVYNLSGAKWYRLH